MDSVTAYRAASEANDIDALMATLSENAELISPLSGRMVFRGRDDLRVLLGAVYGVVSGWRWTDQFSGEGSIVLVGEGRLGPLLLGDAMVVQLDADGAIERLRPHLRPWLALTLFALVIGPKLAPHPGVLMRALRPD